MAVSMALAFPLAAQTDEAPKQVIQKFSDALLDVMMNGPKIGFKGREDKMRPAVADAYDMPAMTRGALGPASKKLTPEQFKQLTDAFDRYTVATYANQFNSFDGERFEVGEPRPSTDGAMVVPSKIVPSSGQPTEIDYLMRQDQGGWKVVDVLLEGSVSQEAVRRSEFVSIYRRDGLQGLIDLLNRQTAAMEPK